MILMPVCGVAQQLPSTGSDTVKTGIVGRVTDAVTGEPLPLIIIKFTGSKYGLSTDLDGKFDFIAPGSFSQVTFSYLGYQTVTRTIKPGQVNRLQIQLHNSQNQLKEVTIRSAKKTKYRNKGNPAVELIQQVIDHKAQNRMESSNYLQYNQYERINLSFIDFPAKVMNGSWFKMYKFMIDTVKTDGKAHSHLPVYFSEKLSNNYYRKDPSKLISVLTAQKEVNVLKFIDTAGLGMYLNRLYGDKIDIYDNNLFIVNRQFLSPIADHSPNYYKFFITDTIQNGKEKLIELSFIPRNNGDILFEGKLYVSMTGNYAVESCELNVNKQTNLNFIRNLQLHLNFAQDSTGKYQLKKSDVILDFGLSKSGWGVVGDRTVVYKNYVPNKPLPPGFYQGKELRVEANSIQKDTAYWTQNRPDTLTAEQAKVYPKVDRLEQMPQFKRATWIAATLTGGYGKWGPVELGPLGALFSYNSQEGARFQIGGRTTPEFSKSVYLEGFGAYGLRDKTFKYNVSTYFTFNKVQFYRFPNDFLKINYQYDIGVPGQSFSIIHQQAALSSFQSGSTNYWLYNRIFTTSYVKDFESHFSYILSFRNWIQRPAGELLYQYNDAAGSLVHDLTTSEINLGLRYAPHEQILQGTVYRRTIHSKYPIFNLQISHGFKGVLNGAYDYTSIGANIYKRFFMSQLGYADVTLMGGYLTGKVPFPLLSISPANQSIAYDPDSYNNMTYLEFVSDHYAGINATQSFNGFFLNKIPLIKHLKWREYLTAKVLFGGLRDENNPLYSGGLYRLPSGNGDSNGTYALGSKPYIEGGIGIGNIFKFLRVDGIKRFSYLDHPGASRYQIKLSFSPHF